VNGHTGPLVVDANGTEVGMLIDAMYGTVLRIVGEDAVTFTAPAAGLEAGALIFFHTSTDCLDQRYMRNSGGVGFVHYAQLHGGMVFYTKLAKQYDDAAVTINAFELVAPNQDPMQPGKCYVNEMGQGSYGPVTMVVDEALGHLAAPLRVK